MQVRSVQPASLWRPGHPSEAYLRSCIGVDFVLEARSFGGDGHIQAVAIQTVSLPKGCDSLNEIDDLRPKKHKHAYTHSFGKPPKRIGEQVMSFERRKKNA